MSSSGKFANIFGDLTKNEVGATSSHSRTNTPVGNGIFKFKIEECNRGCDNRGFTGDEESYASPTSLTSSITGLKCDSSSPNSSQNAIPEPPYNPYDHLDTKHPTSYYGTIFHLIFLSAGSPVLLIPGTFIAAGFVAGSATILTILAFYIYSMRMVLWSAHELCKLKKCPTISYSNLVYEAFDAGPPILRPYASAARLLVAYVFIFGWYSGCVFIYVMTADLFTTVANSWLPVQLTIHQTVLVLFAPMLLLNLIRRLKFLEPCSTLGFSFNLVAIALVLYYTLTDSAPWKGVNRYGMTGKVPLLIGTVFMNINVTGLIISLKNEMKHPLKFEAPFGVMTVAYTVIFVTYFVFSMFLGLKYGTDVKDNAVSIIPSNMFLSLLTSGSYIIGLYLLMPILLYVPMDVLWNVVLKEKQQMTKHRTGCEYALRVILVILAAFLAYLNPNVSFFVSLFGTIGSSIDSVIFPAVIQSLVMWRVGKGGIKTGLVMAKNLVLLFVGFGLMAAGIKDCLNEL